MTKLKLIAYYLPQYHPIPENDIWWGKGFTEWTNVTKAKPLFKGHYQPRLPADLGFYDLRVPEVRDEQAELAKKYGIFGFCYYHYWFGNKKQLLEKPIKEVLATGKPDFPYMFCWANHKWSSHWIGNDSPEILMEQHYLGPQDYVDHFMYLLPYFKDERYIRIDGKVAFQIYKPADLPDLDQFIAIFQQLAEEHGIGRIYFLGGNCNQEQAASLKILDGFTSNELGALKGRARSRIFKNRKSFLGRAESKIRNVLEGSSYYELKKPVIIKYQKAIEHLLPQRTWDSDYYLTVVPDWDNTPRAGKKALILKGSTPALWGKHLETAVKITSKHNAVDRQIIFIKSWNEWAEGNYLEPDAKWGHQYLDVVRRVLKTYDVFQSKKSKEATGVIQ